ncbi:hypothetical protein ACA910_003822 [Epithemia clementina (nom. ined.)]
MSAVYATEPSPSGRIVLETTHGPLDIELWCRECPTTTRFLLQLLLDGYYDNVVFHRILPNTLIQCGAVRCVDIIDAGESSHHQSNKNSKQSATTVIQPSVGQNQESWHNVYYPKYSHGEKAVERQRHELNSRLRFRHRGLVAMALPIGEDAAAEDNSSDEDAKKARQLLHPQFFITLEETPYLDGKHVIVGRITQGPTIFNALRIGQTQVGDNDDDNNNNQPEPRDQDLGEAPRITSARIMDNPIHSNLTPTPHRLIPWKEPQQQQKGHQSQDKKRKRKGKLDVNVLSFADELEPDEVEELEERQGQKRGISSIHDRTTGQDDNDEDNDERKHKKRKKKEKRNKGERKDVSEQQQQSSTANEKEGGEGSISSTGFSRRGPEGDSVLNSVSGGAPNDSSRRRSTPLDAINSKSNSQNEENSTQPKDQPTTTTKIKHEKEHKLDGSQLLQAMRSKTQFTAGARAQKRRRDHNSNGEDSFVSSSDHSILSKLQAFQSRLVGSSGSGAGGASTQRDASSTTTDNSLAARMARRAQLEQQEQENAAARNRADDGEGYHGQILENSHDDADTSPSWMSTKFQCRKHMDIDSIQQQQQAGGGEIIIMGEDGRRADEYEVVDDRERRRPQQQQQQQQQQGRGGRASRPERRQK